jgi:hypothetical protein
MGKWDCVAGEMERQEDNESFELYLPINYTSIA